MENTDIIDPLLINNNLETSFTGRNLIVFKTIDSTNNYAFTLARQYIASGKKDEEDKLNGTVIVSDKQTSGRGRFEKKWFSPSGGLWFSIILKPSASLHKIQNITLLSAAAIAQVLNECYKVDVRIKWPNDIYYNQKKLAGILTESENVAGRIIIVTGIGLNINNTDFGSDYTAPECAVSLSEILKRPLDRNALLADLLNNFEKKYSYLIKTGDLKSIFSKIESLVY